MSVLFIVRGGWNMGTERPSSEMILKKIQYEEEQKKKEKRGKLKIFLGYAAGCGKTYAMLEAAQQAKKNSIDVVAGYIEPHDRPDTQRLAQGLEAIPFLEIEYRGVMLREFDLDAALKRHPQLILVDELAHTNAKDCRNEKRYQDVKELLRAGISVYTTINIQHLESLNDVVENITKIKVKERVPDHVFDQAEQVEMIDIEPESLIDRMKEGKIYRKNQAERALENFFRKEKLVALREITLRRMAERVKRISEEEREIQGNLDYHTGEHVLVCISAAQSNAKVIRTAARLSYAFRCQFTALYVETPAMQQADSKTKERLRIHIELAKTLGAKIVTVFGDDIGRQIAEYAVISNVSKVVIGRTNHRFLLEKTGSGILEKLSEIASNIDIYVIPDMKRKNPDQTKILLRKRQNNWKGIGRDLLGITLVMILTSFAAWMLQRLNFPESNIIMVYILGVLLSSYIADRKIYAVYSSFLGVLAFNFFFTKPYFSLKVYDRGYPSTFIMLFIVGVFTATLTRKLKQQNKENARKAYRMEILLENSRKLRRCKSEIEVWNQIAAQVVKLLNLSLIIYPVKENGEIEAPFLYPKKGEEKIQRMQDWKDQDKAVVQWVVANGHRAGAGTHTLPGASAMYLPVQDENRMKGVIGILVEEGGIQEFEYGLLIAMLNETAVKLQDKFMVPL